jgi:uracil-DNA glycosylase
MRSDLINLEREWQAALSEEFTKPYMLNLQSFLAEQKSSGKVIFPEESKVFHAFNATPLSRVRVVILGQDPYHGAGQAHGLCFSVKDAVPPPPSLKNIFKELESDLGIPRPKNGNLNRWAEQGVLLLNSVLTVEEGHAASHRKKGWEQFTDAVISLLGKRKEPIVFLLWGAFAQSKESMILVPPHVVLKSAHPSPLSAYQGFLGCKHFSQVNAILKRWGHPEIDWRLT